MGRTPSTITTDSTTLDKERFECNPLSKDYGQELGLLESARAFSIMERIIVDIYTKRTVPLGLLHQISQELQEASSRVPMELRTLSNPDSPAVSPRGCQQQVLRNAGVACNYYFSMMLLTRPFLITILRTKGSRANIRAEGRSRLEDPKIYGDVSQGAMACIDAAIKTLKLLHEVLLADMLFNNMPLFV